MVGPDPQPDQDRLSDDQRAALAELVKGELIALSWRNATTMTVLGPLVLIAVYFGIEGRVSPQSLWIWLSVHGVLMLGRLVMVSAWAIRKPQGRQRLRWVGIFWPPCCSPSVFTVLGRRCSCTSSTRCGRPLS
jgi:hypothetical protein